MATAREHISEEVHEATAAHEDSLAEQEDGLHKSAMNMAARHRNLHKESGLTDHAEIAAEWENRARLHEAKSTSHQEHAAHHRAAASKCSKAAEADLSKLRSDRISGVIPSAPAFGSGVRPVFRAGQRDFGAKAEVPLEFESLVAIEDTLD